MKRSEIVSTFKAALRNAGYEDSRVRRDYQFSDFSGTAAEVRRIDLAAFAGYPHSYRNARIGVVLDGRIDEFSKEYCALGAPLIFSIDGTSVQPWTISISGASRVGDTFEVSDAKGVFHKQRDSWGPDKLCRIKSPEEVVSRSEPDFFDRGLVPALERLFQTRLKELLECSFQEIATAYKQVHGQSPRVSPLFAFLFRFVTAKIFMDRADAKGWDNLTDPQDILDAAERQTGLLGKPESEFRRKRILEAAWSSVSNNLHFQNLSVPDLAFVAESAFIMEQTRDELGVHSTPAGLAEYVVNNLSWDEVPIDERYVLEPFCGHGIFLAKAMERLARDLNPSFTPKQRHEFFRKRLVGVETDTLSLEICRLVLTLSDYPNSNSWNLHLSDVFCWEDWEDALNRASVVLANPPYEAFNEKYRLDVKAVKTKPPAEFLRRVLQNPPKLLGLVLPQSFLTDPVSQDLNRELARRYGNIKIVELPRIFRYANNETIALMAGSLRGSGKKVRVHYAEVRKDSVDAFLHDWHVSVPRTAEQQVPALNEFRFSLRLPPPDSIFIGFNTGLTLGDVAEIHKGINWKARGDGKTQSAPRTDVASNRFKTGYKLGAEKMRGNLSQFQLRTLRYLSLLDKDQDPSTRANRRPWEGRKVICNAGRLQLTSPWRLVSWADSSGLAFTKQFFAIWPRADVSEFALAAILSSPFANAFSFEKDLERDNHIQTLVDLPLPELKHLVVGGELHRRAVELQKLLEVHDFALYPAIEKVTALFLRLDAAVLDAYNLPASSQYALLKKFNGWARPLPPPFDSSFGGYFPDHFEEEITLAELLAITLDWDVTSLRKTQLIEKKIKLKASDDDIAELDRLKFLTEARGEYFAPLPTQKITGMNRGFQPQGDGIDG